MSTTMPTSASCSTLECVNIQTTKNLSGDDVMTYGWFEYGGELKLEKISSFNHPRIYSLTIVNVMVLEIPINVNAVKMVLLTYFSATYREKCMKNV